jgi:hypothetical protein
MVGIGSKNVSAQKWAWYSKPRVKKGNSIPKINIKTVDAILPAGWNSFWESIPFSIFSSGFSGRAVIFHSLVPQFY